MTRARIAVLLVLAATAGCKKKSESAPADPSAPPASESEIDMEKPEPGQPSASIAPLPPAQDGPAYLAIWGKGIARLELDGWKVIAPFGAAIAMNGDALYAISAQQVFRWSGTELAELQPSPGETTGHAVASDGTLWVIAGGKLQHHDGTAWITEALPAGELARGVAPAREGLWVRTLDRTYRRAGTAWTPIDVPGVTGTEEDIVSLSTHGDDAYLATGKGIYRFDGKAWTQLPLRMKVELGDGATVIAGPGGRYAVNLGNGGKLVGDIWRGVRPLGIGQTGLQPHMIYLYAMDDRGRTWGAASGAVLVFDERGNVAKKWTTDDGPLFSSNFVNIVVSHGGPAHLDAGERAAGTVTGKVEGSAAGIEITACAVKSPAYNSDNPCAGSPNARSTKTVAGGGFTLEGVSIGPIYFWVKRGGRWRETGETGCCDKLAPDGTIDVGTLSLK